MVRWRCLLKNRRGCHRLWVKVILLLLTTQSRVDHQYQHVPEVYPILSDQERRHDVRKIFLLYRMPCFN